ncbi:MAG: hypothetical protein AVDCRST_MAG87-346 [uncultured Thermomicrobiales bacterium]|uniref:Uncharacterized protein n=1 Tax=uncultured Thermomicrobiales bacterium TaxID=1645740 RepID=A0A6J4U9Z6_9BACT|nr:MAG: hypothetical protein AVDCRST_MAG87-346 [uncultured Thermomicrobiales bacterium]
MKARTVAASHGRTKGALAGISVQGFSTPASIVSDASRSGT